MIQATTSEKPAESLGAPEPVHSPNPKLPSDLVGPTLLLAGCESIPGNGLAGSVKLSPSVAEYAHE